MALDKSGTGKTLNMKGQVHKTQYSIMCKTHDRNVLVHVSCQMFRAFFHKCNYPEIINRPDFLAHVQP